MQYFKQQRALRFSRASLLIGMTAIPLWILLLILAVKVENDFTAALFLVLPLITALTGLTFGVIGLVQSIWAVSRTKRGIVFSIIGMIINLFVLCISVFVWILLLVGDAQPVPLP